MKEILRSYRSENHKYLIYCTPFALYLFLVINSIAGAGFGEHWDEHAFLRPACESIYAGTLLPHEYIYPSFCYYVILIAGWVYTIFTGISDARLLISSPQFYFYIRTVFIIISSLSVFWVYFLSLKITKDFYPALFAGILLCASYELSYHLRWAVSDCIVMQFAVLSVLILFLNLERRNKIIFSSLIAGICAGTKYTGGMILLNVFLFIITTSIREKRNVKYVIADLLIMGMFSLIGFLITTPGAVLENSRFISDLKLQSSIYSTGHFGHTVNSGFGHFSKNLLYIVTEFFSGNDFISILIFLLAVYGITVSVAQRNILVINLFVTLLFYVIFVSGYKVMIVRNMMYLLPFFAVFASIGVYHLKRQVTNASLRYALIICTVIPLIYSCTIVVISSYKLNQKDKTDLSAELNEYVSSHPDICFIFSRKAELLHDKIIKASEYADTCFVFFKNEVPFEFYKANLKGQFRDVIGVNDVNFDYYPTWSGADRLIVMKYSDADSGILRYSLEGRSSLILCDSEVKKNENDFGITYRNGTSPSEMINIAGAKLQSNERSYSGKFSVKQDSNNVYGFRTSIVPKVGAYYRMSVRRNSPSGNGFLVLGENNFYNRAWYPAERRNGWDKICFDYYCSSESPSLELSTWLQDVSSPAYFDDLEIEIIE